MLTRIHFDLCSTNSLMKYLQRQECDGGELEGRQKTVAHSHGNIQHQSEEESQQVTGQSGQLLAPGLASLLAGDWLGVLFTWLALYI